ncbi:MAG: hypothetical protein OHK0046_04070 [Anaerolineae bacterium]
MVLRVLQWIALLVLLTACGARDEMQSTMEAGRSLYATESVALAVAANMDRTQAAATLSVGSTQLAQVESVNRQVYATLAVGSTPTPALIEGNARPSNTGMIDDMSSDVLRDRSDGTLIATGITDTIGAADGCVVNSRTSFPASTSVLYATMRVYTIQPGTPLRAEWFHEGELRITDNWDVDIYSDDRCLWFSLENTRTEFTPGEWLVQIYAKDWPIGDPQLFFITAE